MKKMKILTLLVVTVLITIILSCSTTGNDNGNNEENILPYEVGNQWQYIRCEKNETKIDTIVLIQYISGKETINYNNEELDLYKWVWYLPIDTLEMTINIYPINDGIMACSQDYITHNILFKYPVSVGDEWTCNWDGTGTCKCHSTNTTIQTPVGDFDCIIYGFYGSDNNLFMEMYVCKGVGIVYIYNYDSDYEIYLKSYTIVD